MTLSGGVADDEAQMSRRFKQRLGWGELKPPGGKGTIRSHLIEVSGSNEVWYSPRISASWRQSNYPPRVDRTRRFKRSLVQRILASWWQRNYPLTCDRSERVKRSLVWWSWPGLNRRPRECHSRALPTALQPHVNRSDEE